MSRSKKPGSAGASARVQGLASRSRGARLAAEFEAALAEFIRLIESLTDEQWVRMGRNYPQRLNDEDEHRTVGVIAHHVAISMIGIMERIQASVDGRPLLQPSSGTLRQAVQAVEVENARHAVEHAGVTNEEVLQLLREQQPRIVAALRAISDDQLDQVSHTPAGPMSIAQRIERVLIGHLRMHQGSIQAAIS